MTLKDSIRGMEIIRAVAKQTGVTEELVHRELSQLIDEAWDSTDPAVKARQAQLFAFGKPSPEELIITLGNAIK